MYVEYTKLCTFFKNVYIEFIELYTFFKKLCTWNVQNWVHYLKIMYV